MPTVVKLVRDAVSRLRLKLVDLTNRNRLLNFKFSDSSRKFVRVVDELPDALYVRLTQNGAADGRLYFAALPEPPIEMLKSIGTTTHQQELTGLEIGPAGIADVDSSTSNQPENAWRRKRQPDPHSRINVIEWAKQNGINPSYELPKPGLTQATDRYSDNQIQTMLFSVALEKKLAALREDANVAQQETGVKTLYVAFGFLEWFESDDSDEARYAPLFLLPVDIDRELRQNRYRYFIESAEEAEPVINVSLQERLKRDFGISLPTLQEDDTPESYLARVGRALRSQKRWNVRRFLVVGHFSFARLVMYQDLATENWQGAPLEENKLLSTLLAGAADASGDTYAAEYEVDEHEIEAHVPVLITDADSSQFSAIVDAMKGRSFAIQGPPGTGKSQTITNLIAAALAAGKTVLFVAEKQAALQVVSKRLCEAGLGPFLLELHSTKIQKKHVLNGFEERLKIRKSRIEDKLERSLVALREIRAQLKFYVGIMNREVGQSGVTLHDVYWREQRTRRDLTPEELIASSSLDLSSAPQLTTHAYADFRALLERLANSFIVVASANGGISAHPLIGLNKPGIGDAASVECRSKLQLWEQRLLRLDRALARSKEIIGHSLPLTGPHLQKVCLAISSLPEVSPLVLANCLAELTDPKRAQSFNSFVTLTRRIISDRKPLVDLFEDLDLILPNADELSRQAKALWPAAQQSGVADQFLSKMPETLKERDEELTTLEAAFRVLEQFVSAADLHVVLTSSRVGDLVDVVRLLQMTPGYVIAARSELLFNSDVLPILEDARKVSAGLRSESESLLHEALLTFNEEPARLRDAAAVLRDTAPILRVFSSKYRAARKFARGLSKRPWPGARAAASNLVRMTDLIERRQAFERQPVIKSLAGHNFSGIETPFDTLIGVVMFWEAVRKRWRSLDAGARPLQKLLLYADKVLLEDLKSGFSSRDLELLQSAAKLYAGHPDSSISVYLDASKQSLAVANESVAALLKVRYRHEIDVSKTAGAFAKLASLLQCQSAARCSTFSSLVTDPGVPSARDVERLELTSDVSNQILSSELPQEIKARLMSPKCAAYLEAAREFAKLVLTGLNACIDARNDLVTTHQLDTNQWSRGVDLEQCRFPDQLERLKEALNASGQSIAEWAVYRNLANEVTESGLSEFVEALSAEKVTPTGLPSFFDRVYQRSLIRHTVGQYPRLNVLTGENIENLRKRLVQLDHDYMKLSHGAVVARLSCVDVPVGISQGAAGAYTERSLIERETAKQRRHISIRDLIRRAADASRALKPCFMMSPSSVAQFLPAGRELFDLVIIDEASQMRPEDSLGAIARAKQAIVVGDPMQLPPTTFFDAVQDDDEIKEDEDLDVDTESVLDMAISSYRPHRELRWHYRSQHHSLIAFSNREFYRDNLIVFPSLNRAGYSGGLRV